MRGARTSAQATVQLKWQADASFQQLSLKQGMVLKTPAPWRSPLRVSDRSRPIFARAFGKASTRPSKGNTGLFVVVSGLRARVAQKAITITLRANDLSKSM